jgi:polyhydroxyalkanoate synthesis repressor PhaR
VTVVEPRIIKKYPNRRLYDTELSKYVTLVDLRKLIHDEVEFKVMDSRSGEDITRSILIQIITEQEAGDEALFSTDMLTDIIRYYDAAVHDVFHSYLDQSMRAFTEQQQFIQESMEGLVGTRAVKDMADLAQHNVELWMDMQKGFLKAAGLGSGKVSSRKKTKR